MRVLVTGSRNWSDGNRVAAALTECLNALPKRDRLVIVHGGARGADRIAGEWAWWAHGRRLPVDRPEVHKARWNQPCPADRCPPNHRREDKSGGSTCPMAGYYRNEYMVSLGADVVLAFLMPCDKKRCKDPQPHPSHGAAQCVQCARFAGLDVIPFLAPDLAPVVATL